MDIIQLPMINGKDIYDIGGSGFSNKFKIKGERNHKESFMLEIKLSKGTYYDK
jgi:hypothetical protein